LRPKAKEPFKANLLFIHQTSSVGEAKKTAFKIVVPRRGIGINKGEAHETS
jgi:hypothetical protein